MEEEEEEVCLDLYVTRRIYCNEIYVFLVLKFQTTVGFVAHGFVVPN